MLDLLDLVSFFVFVTGIVLFVRFFVFNPYTVVGSSMEPMFEQGDFIIVDKVTPRVGDLHRGDVVVFVPKWKDIPFIKRIIGLPGETVKIKDGEVSVCNESGACELLSEVYLPEGLETETKCKIDEFVVPAESKAYFVLGDNRPYSTDSRCCFGYGCFEGANYLVYPEDMIGKVALRLYPNIQTHR